MGLRHINTVWVFCTILITASCNHEQDGREETLDQEKEIVSPEISHSHITSFAEDKWGHVWIGTSHGLNKHIVSGYHQYLASPDSLTLDDNHISALLRDSRQRLWVASLNCRLSLLTDDGKFRRIPLDYNKTARTQLIETTEGRVLLNAENRVFVYDEANDKMLQIIDSPEKNIGCFALNDGLLMVIYEHRAEIYRLQPFQKTVTIDFTDCYKTASQRNQQEIWLAARGKLDVMDLHQIQPAPQVLQAFISRKNVTVCQVLEYDAQTLIVNTKELGTIVYNTKEQTLFTPDDADYPNLIGKYNTSSIFLDTNKNLWIGSDGGGYKVVNSQKGFFHQLTDNGLFNKMQITSLANDSMGQSLWVVAFKRELYRYDFATNKAHFVWRADGESMQEIKEIAVGSPDELWITMNSRIIKVSCRNSLFTVEQSFSVENTEDIVIDKDKQPWVLVRGGRLLRYAPDQRAFQQVYQYQHQPGAKTFMTILRDGNMLVGGMDGSLVEINVNTLQVSTVASIQDLQQTTQSSHFVPEVMKEDAQGNLWIGTQNDGVLIISRHKKTIVPVKGINCDEVSSIEQDVDGHVWIGTQYGLYECDPNGKRINGFFRHDGLSSNAFSERASVRLANGTLVFGQLQGMTVFKPTGKQEKKDIRIVLEDLKVNNRLIIPGIDQPIERPLSDCQDIRLAYNQNNFSISYAVLDYRRVNRAHYYYRLEGYDKAWTDAGGNQEAFYSNVPSGDYTFSVRIEDHSKRGDYFTQSIQVHISPAPWATWWAYLIYIVMTVLTSRHYYQMYRRSAIERQRVRQAEEEKRQEQRTNEINKRYFANVAHQLRTPVTMIAAPIQQLVGDKEVKGRRHELLKVVNHNVGRMIRLVNQLMDFNKLETDALRLRVRLVDTAPLLKRTLDIYRMNAEEKGITFHTDGLDDNCFAYVDTDKLVNILDNLLSNAIKFTPQGGQISLSMSRIVREEAEKEFKLSAQDTDSQYVMIKVSDTGPGIPDEELQRIFERYYQVDAHQKGYFNWGTGIGLYYSLRLTQLHHGHIAAENNPNHQGATFKFILPSSADAYTEEECSADEHYATPTLDAAYPHTKAIPLQDESEKVNLNQPRVLVVDDDTDISYFLRTLLTEQYRVTCCYDVESAKRQMQEQMPDIVVSDVVMTGDSGIDLCRYVKTELQFSHIPVILLTAKSNLEDQLEGIGAGADAYIAKPFNSAFLQQTIETTLRNRELIRKQLTEEAQPVTKNADGLLPQDKAFLDELYRIMDRELANDEFNVTAIVEEMHLSHSKFIYKVKGLTGLTPSDFFKTYKLNKAAALLRRGEYNISEVAYMTGFSTLAHFSKVFKKKFGVSPSQYINPDAECS